LTKGQASPTTDPGYTTKVQTDGVVQEPFHPLQLAIAMGCGFVARGFSTESGQLSELISAGVQHRGFSLIDVLQPCVSFNRKNTHNWYRERVYTLDESYDPSDRMAAFEKATEWGDRIPLGILYQEEKPAFEDKLKLRDIDPLAEQDPEQRDLSAVRGEFV
jgi:2-oxoglutarate ferredoxin oxidoreductase subunit beta